jgi:polar amino acid transport system substrate-binding protein
MNIIKAGLLSLLLAVSYGASHPVLAKEITIATFEYETEQVNSAINVMTEIYQNIGYDMTLIRFPSKRSLVEANAGLTEGELFRIKGVEKYYPNLVRLPHAMGILKAMALTRAGEPKIVNILGLRDKKVGILSGLEYTKILTKGLDREVPNSIDSLFAILLAGRVDVIIFPKLDGQKYIKTHQLKDKINISDQPLIEIPLYHFLHKDSSAALEKLSKEMTEMKNSGALDKLIERVEQSQY